MIYYKLGADSIKSFVSEGSRQWGEFGAKRPVQRKVVVLASILFTIVLILGALAPTVGYDSAELATKSSAWFGTILNGGVLESPKGS